MARVPEAPAPTKPPSSRTRYRRDAAPRARCARRCRGSPRRWSARRGAARSEPADGPRPGAPRPARGVRDTVRAARATRCVPRRIPRRPTRPGCRTSCRADSVMQRLMTLRRLQPHALSGERHHLRGADARRVADGRALVERDSQIVKSDTILYSGQTSGRPGDRASATSSSSPGQTAPIVTQGDGALRPRPSGASPAPNLHTSFEEQGQTLFISGRALRRRRRRRFAAQRQRRQLLRPRRHRHRVRRLHSRLLLQGEGDQAHGHVRRRAAGDPLHRRRARDVAALHLPGRARRTPQRPARAQPRRERHHPEQPVLSPERRRARLLLGDLGLLRRADVSSTGAARPARRSTGDPGFVRYNGEFRYRWLERYIAGNLAVSQTNQGGRQQHRDHVGASAELHAQQLPDREHQLRHEHDAPAQHDGRTRTPRWRRSARRSTTSRRSGRRSSASAARNRQYPGRTQVDRNFPTLSLTTSPLNLGSWLTWTPNLNYSSTQTLNIDQPTLARAARAAGHDRRRASTRSSATR